MEEIRNTNRNYQMLIYLADRGQLINQLDVCNALWDELLEAPYEKLWFRDLRIHLRRLRSALALLEPLLPDEGELWLNQLRLRSGQLGNVREYDVAFQACTKYEAFALEALNSNPDCADELLMELPRLKVVLLEAKESKAAVFTASAQPGCISQEMSLCAKLLQKQVELCIEDEAKANAFLQSRLQIWGLKLCNKLKNLEKLNTTNQLHKLRIKVKRFRYAYEVYMGKAADEELLLSLKELQDILGSLHDSDRNVELIEALLADRAEDLALQQEFICFKNWRRLKVEQRIAQLPSAQHRVLNAMKEDIVGVELL